MHQVTWRCLTCSHEETGKRIPFQCPVPGCDGKPLEVRYYQQTALDDDLRHAPHSESTIYEMYRRAYHDAFARVQQHADGQLTQADFAPCQYGITLYGKEIPVEYRADKVTVKGVRYLACVNLDDGHAQTLVCSRGGGARSIIQSNGPECPHLGWEVFKDGKDAGHGHILLHWVPAWRSKEKG